VTVTFCFRIGSNQLEGFRLDFLNALKTSVEPKVCGSVYFIVYCLFLQLPLHLVINKL